MEKLGLIDKIVYFIFIIMCANLANNLRDRLKRRHLTATSLEKIAGLTTGTLANILNGRSKSPKLETLKAIAIALQTSVEELTEKEYKKHPWNYELFFSVLQEIEPLIRSQNLHPSYDEMESLIKKIYIYSIGKGDIKADKHFTQWLVQEHFK